MNERQIRVLLVEDRQEDGESIERAMHQSGLNVATRRTASGDGFARAVHDFAPDVVLAAHALAQFDALAALQALRTLRPATPLIVMSRELEPATAVAWVRAGAQDVVLKDGLERLAPAVTAAIHARRPLEGLSPRQLQVLCLVADGLTTKEIGERLGISDKTVETHRGEIMKRTGIHDVVSLVRMAVRLGLVPVGAPPDGPPRAA